MRGGLVVGALPRLLLGLQALLTDFTGPGRDPFQPPLEGLVCGRGGGRVPAVKHGRTRGLRMLSGGLALSDDGVGGSRAERETTQVCPIHIQLAR